MDFGAAQQTAHVPHGLLGRVGHLHARHPAGLGQRAEKRRAANFDDYATNSIDLYGGWTSKPWMGYEKGRRIRMRASDLEILRREFPEIEEVAANSWLSGHKATYGKEFTQVWLRGSLPRCSRSKASRSSRDVSSIRPTSTTTAR